MRIVVLGEGMVELSREAGGGWRVGYGGDSLNTAIHLARFGMNVAYASALGTDPFSEDLRAAWAAEGLDTSLVLADPNRLPGIYAISTAAAGERSFHYWRSESAARGMFALPASDDMLDAAIAADLLYFSLISLAILPPEGRSKLFGLAHSVRARGGKVAFDSNYRPRLWGSKAEAQAIRDTALRCCDIVLPTLDDERALSACVDAAAAAGHCMALGAGEVAVKLGAQGCYLGNGQVVMPPAVLEPVDTSGAGDAFNAGYLHARMNGATPAAAALSGHRLAAWVIAQPGAIPGRMVLAPYGSASAL